MPSYPVIPLPKVASFPGPSITQDGAGGAASPAILSPPYPSFPALGSQNGCQPMMSSPPVPLPCTSVGVTPLNAEAWAVRDPPPDSALCTTLVAEAMPLQGQKATPPQGWQTTPLSPPSDTPLKKRTHLQPYRMCHQKETEGCHLGFTHPPSIHQVSHCKTKAQIY